MSVSDPQPFGSFQVNGASVNEALLRVNSNAHSQGREHSREFSTAPLADLLLLASSYIANASESKSKLLVLLARLRERLIAQRFQLAVLGQFKRGKSTLLNALLGADVLPIGVVPVTAIPTFLEAGATSILRVTHIGGEIEELKIEGPEVLRERLTDLVTEEGNPANALRIARVDVRFSSQLLESGVVLIDTPGVGSTVRHNSATADAILSECDATLFVLSADPPITQVEIEFLARIRQAVARCIVVLNKIDLLETKERDQAIAFLRRVLIEEGKFDPSTPIFCVSARKALRAAETRDTDDFEASGLAGLEAYLSKFLATEKRAALETAIAGKAAALVGELRLETELTLRALRLPIEDLERRVAAFDVAIKGFEMELRTVSDLLAGDRRRAIQELEAEAERLRTESRSVLQGQLDLALQKNEDPRGARETLSQSVVALFDEALKEVIQDAGDRLAATLRVHQVRADELIASVRRTAADLMEIPFRAPPSEEAFAPRRDPFWVTQQNIVALSPIPPEAMDKFLPASMRRKRARQRLIKEIELVLIRNVENLRWATIQNLQDAFRRFGSELDERLTLSLAATRGAMKAALDRRKRQAEAIQAEIGAMEAEAGQLLDTERELRRRAQS
jgi:ribosome biogenesis GTPase A